MKLEVEIGFPAKSSRPRKGAWIEINLDIAAILMVSRPRKGAWIEIPISARSASPARGRPRKGAWIEINQCYGI